MITLLLFDNILAIKGIEIISILALQLAPKLFCMHFQLWCNVGEDTTLTQAYIDVNQPLRDYHACIRAQVHCLPPKDT